MKYRLAACLLIASSLWLRVPAFAQPGQPDQNPAMNAPDKVAWQLFIEVNTSAGGSNATFETWAADADTFKPDPQFPPSPTPLILHSPALLTAARQEAQAHGRLLPAVPPKAGDEESRRNLPAFNFIRQHNLYKVSGLKAAFGQTISFPVDSIEVKGNWLSADQIASDYKVAIADIPKLFHVNTGVGPDGQPKQYGLVAMHVISKLVPSWTWATFEHRLNPARCDILGCKDSFGAQTPYVPRNPAGAGLGYPDCVKTPALNALISNAKWDPAFTNYCLKGSQADLTDNTGLDVRVGNSVTEDGFVATSSCMTCHSNAGWTQNGKPTAIFIGFDKKTGNPIGALGPINTKTFWTTTENPPIFQGMPGLKQVATSADFVWSIPFCAYDDTIPNPKPKPNCTNK
jgi:hypothetical protein